MIIVIGKGLVGFGMLSELRFDFVGIGWLGNVFYFRVLVVLLSIGFEVDKSKGSFEVIVLIFCRYDENYEFIIF